MAPRVCALSNQTGNMPFMTSPRILRLTTAIALVSALPVAVSAQEAYLNTDVPSFMRFGFTNERNDPRYLTAETNAGVRLLDGFLKVWEPSSPFVDAANPVAGADGLPGVEAADWTGLPGDATDGRILNQAFHDHNIAYSAMRTRTRTAEDEIDAYLDDRRAKGYSVTTGLGPLQDAWFRGTKQFTTITGVPADAGSVKYDDQGNNNGMSDWDGNADLGLAVELVNRVGYHASSEPGKRYYKYARPWRWSDTVKVQDSLLPARSSTPERDGGFPSGHTAEAFRDALTIAYMVPQRFQEMVTRAYSLGDSRIIAGMHSPMDVISGRMLGTASAVYMLNREDGDDGFDWATLKRDAHAQAQAWLMKETGSATASDLYVAAHTGDLSVDRFADRAANAAYIADKLTYGFAPISDQTAPVHVPEGAEVLLETRMPYLTADQRRMVLATTALPAGLPVMDDEEGYGRLNLFAAADGFGAFDGDVSVTMDRDRDGFHAFDSWNNDIGGTGGLTKDGTGTLMLTGLNTYAGDTRVAGGTLVGSSGMAFGAGDVRVDAGAALIVNTLVASTMANDLSGAGRFDKRGAGHLTYAGQGAAFRGATEVTGGTLAVTGTLGGTVAVAKGGTLAGNGRVGTTTVQAGGRMGPGTSLGTLTVDGDLTLAKGAIYDMEYASTGVSDTAVVRGTAMVEGATLNAVATDRTASYLHGQSYDVLTADAVTGRFGDLLIDSAFINSRLIHDATGVTLRLSTQGARSFTEAARTGNQRAVAAALDDLDQTAGSASLALYNAVLFSDDAGARLAFDQLSAEDHASAGSALLAMSHVPGDTAMDRLAADGRGVWAQGYGTRARLDGRGPSYDTTGGGLFVGADGMTDDRARIGFMIGVGQSSVDRKGSDASTDVDSLHMGLYAGTEVGAVALRGGIAYSHNQLETERSVVLDGFSDRLMADYDADLTQIFAEVSTAMTRTQRVELRPFAALTHAILSTDSFAETGGAAALQVQGDTSRATFATVGLRAKGEIDARSGWNAEVSWQHAFGDITPERRAAFAGGADFAVSGAPIGENSARIALGTDLAISETARVGIAYDGQFSDEHTAHVLRADFRMRF
ncbi:autotransporter domain-containing protein [Falsirhodobacter halotolerans]|uniref:autotransporter domain-containing protein n=1 Tax=Falsirhodobacter halotolerans TaxID=1146892 RepID=UPI001FD2A3F4|nr:autotransporter domain-containing protein [Falsirhodobacter halotolerans]MCJ8140865.1 autotransporter domain-containing protein [Falsirhodobacter halotolerans]